MSPKNKLYLFRAAVVAPSLAVMIVLVLIPQLVWLAVETQAERISNWWENRISPWIEKNIGDPHRALKAAAQDCLKKPGILPGRSSDPTSWGVE